MAFEPTRVSTALLAWYRDHGRQLPWRTTRDPYRIWLSEIMLQQTGVQAVIPYYERFLANFPDVETLAAAPVEQVIALWAGLGYYSRARNLHAAAVQLCEGHGGHFPSELEELMALPGVGRSTAGAIRSIAFDLKGPILDGNVRRVLCRLYGWQDDPRSSRAEKQLWQWAEALTPADAAHDYAQAIMDLGATCCTPRQPLCADCPLASFCVAYGAGLQHELPHKRNKKRVPQRQEVALVIRSARGVAVRRRPLHGMLAGLWEFPSRQLEAELDVAQLKVAAGQLAAELLAADAELQPLGQVQHVYSHFKVTVYGYALTVNEALAADLDCHWCDDQALAQLPLHGSHKKIRQTLLPPVGDSFV